MTITDFEKVHIKEAQMLGLANYNEEKANAAALPELEQFPDLEPFASNGLGVAAFEGERMIGYLCCYSPRNHAFGSQAKGVFSPIQAHGAVKENRGIIYQRMYQAAAQKWVEHNIAYHSIALYAHDCQAQNAMFTYGFGRRCVDAVRAMESIPCRLSQGIVYAELSSGMSDKVRQLRLMLAEHMGKSPCFMCSVMNNFEQSLAEKEMEDNRIFVAEDAGKVIAFVEVSDEAETFAATETEDMCNICSAFCLPEYRGRDIYQNLLNYMINQMKNEGYNRLGVDYESFNPTANAFWPKYFTEYTHSVVRRIDECAMHD